MYEIHFIDPINDHYPIMESWRISLSLIIMVNLKLFFSSVSWQILHEIEDIKRINGILIVLTLID